MARRQDGGRRSQSPRYSLRMARAQASIAQVTPAQPQRHGVARSRAGDLVAIATHEQNAAAVVGGPISFDFSPGPLISRSFPNRARWPRPRATPETRDRRRSDSVFMALGGGWR